MPKSAIKTQESRPWKLREQTPLKPQNPASSAQIPTNS